MFGDEGNDNHSKRQKKDNEPSGIFLLKKGLDVETLATEPKEALAALVPRKEY